MITIKYRHHLPTMMLAFFLVGLSMVTLTACGDSATATPLPQPTTVAASAATTTPSSGSNANGPTSSGTNNETASNPGTNTPTAPFMGNITSYDTTSRILAVKGADGTSQQFTVLTNSRINKPVKITLAELATLANGTNNITVMAQKNADGSYNATGVTIIDQASMIAAFGPNLPGGNGANARPAAGSPGAAANNPNPAANRPPAGPGANGAIQIQRGVLSGNQLKGTDPSGGPLVVNLSDTTSIIKLIAGSVEDLKAGTNISIISRPSQDNSTMTAAVINLAQS